MNKKEALMLAFDKLEKDGKIKYGGNKFNRNFINSTIIPALAENNNEKISKKSIQYYMKNYTKISKRSHTSWLRYLLNSVNYLYLDNNKTVCGIGIYDSIIPVVEHGKIYNTWSGMIARGFDENVKNKYPSYKNATVCEKWLRFSNFNKWAQFRNFEGLELDKDIIMPGNQVYCEHFCCFVPKELNNLLKYSQISNGDLPIGVYKDKGKYCAQISIKGKRKHLGTFISPDLAHEAWSLEKIKEIKKWINLISNSNLNDKEKITDGLNKHINIILAPKLS